MTASLHVPVLLAEVLALLQPRRGQTLLDATVGTAGHALALLDAIGPEGRLIGIDRDPHALAIAAERLAARCREHGWPEPFPFLLVRGNFHRLDALLAAHGIATLHGALFDLGVSTLQLETPERGFSFRAEAPLDLRMDPDEPTTAADLVNTLSEAELAAILREYGEERHARAIAREIVARRPLRTTRELAEICARIYPTRERRGEAIHPATRTFMALRIAVNRELDALAPGVRAAIDRLVPGGRIAVIAYHSLEDRLVKEEFRYLAGGCRCPRHLPACVCGAVARIRILTPKPVRPTPLEIAANPRARSARLRAAERLATT